VLFEITEDELISNLQSASGTIRRLQHVGCRFGLDDFGSGFSSLSYLKMLPIDFIKIDGSFTRDLVHEPFQQALIRAIKGISNALGVQTVAEFVETPEELALLREIGIDHAQGFFLQKPRNQPFTKEEIAASLGAYVDKSVVI
jgi:EAL domain-containing protein (putative c-di-GMP-specific phosphodiesterase class I)